VKKARILLQSPENVEYEGHWAEIDGVIASRRPIFALSSAYASTRNDFMARRELAIPRCAAAAHL